MNCPATLFQTSVFSARRPGVFGALALADGRLLTRGARGTARLWPGSTAQLIDWADKVIDRIEPLSAEDRERFYLGQGRKIPNQQNNDLSCRVITSERRHSEIKSSFVS